MKIEVFHAGGCAGCSAPTAELKRAALAAYPGRASWSELDVVAHIDRAVDLGVLSVPALAIDGTLVFARLPTVPQLLGALAARAAGA